MVFFKEKEALKADIGKLMISSLMVLINTNKRIDRITGIDVIMEKIVRIGKLEEQDEFRREDVRKMSPNKRVDMVLKMQRKYCQWDVNTKIERVVSIKKIEDQ